MLAQTIPNGGSLAPEPGLSDSSASSTPAGGKKKAAAEQAPQGPTTIDSDNMDYDEKTRIAIFTGDNYGVYVKDPSFVVYCDKLTAHMRKGGAATTGTSGAKTSPSASPKGKASSADAAASRGNGLQEALAEGPAERPVVIVQDKPATNGEQPQHNVGIAAKADYNADTGDIVLTGWPRVSQGINTQIATSGTTVMIMNKDGHTMKTYGPSHSIIQQSDQPKKTGTDSYSQDQSSAESPAPSPQ
jgi:lipopolysaccharide export system protein LptA